MTYLLYILMSTGVALTSTTIEFKTKEACEQAIQDIRHYKRLGIQMTAVCVATDKE